MYLTMCILQAHLNKASPAKITIRRQVIEMYDKEIADIAARIVLAAIQSDGLLASKVDDVCKYYAKIYSQLVSCDSELRASSTNLTISDILP